MENYYIVMKFISHPLNVIMIIIALIAMVNKLFDFAYLKGYKHGNDDGRKQILEENIVRMRNGNAEMELMKELQSMIPQH
jgi:hypothetical protein